MANYEAEIKKIVYEEFSKLIVNIESDFGKNFINKRYNFLLSQLDQNLTANMVFVSSFESKSGFAIETCAKRIARLTYGDENVPTIVNPRGLKIVVPSSSRDEQIVVTDVAIHDGNLQGEVATFRGKNEASGKGALRTESKVTQESIKRDLLPLSKKYKKDQGYSKPVDLAFFDGTDWNIMEIKAGGDLDSSNAPKNVEKLLTIYVGMGIPNCKAYFATLYNKDGEGNTWTGAVKKHMAFPEMFLIGKQFWNKILPKGVNYERFTELYKEALEELDLNARINSMIKNTLKK